MLLVFLTRFHFGGSLELSSQLGTCQHSLTQHLKSTSGTKRQTTTFLSKCSPQSCSLLCSYTKATSKAPLQPLPRRQPTSRVHDGGSANDIPFSNPRLSRRWLADSTMVLHLQHSSCSWRAEWCYSSWIACQPSARGAVDVHVSTTRETDCHLGVAEKRWECEQDRRDCAGWW